jgi:hypothetical protein
MQGTLRGLYPLTWVTKALSKKQNIVSN